ncbi:MAG: hypothetical protein ACJ79K_06005 [Gemmatimonadaceae bacterium]
MFTLLTKAGISVMLAGSALLAGSTLMNEGAPKSSCAVRGTWELVSATQDGKPSPMTGQERKIVTGHNYMWINQESRRDTLPLKTSADSLRYSTLIGGSGSYTLSGNSYVEHVDYFFLPSYLGQDIKATCRTTKDHWTHAFSLPAAAGAAPVMEVEEWRRIE